MYTLFCTSENGLFFTLSLQKPKCRGLCVIKKTCNDEHKNYPCKKC